MPAGRFRRVPVNFIGPEAQSRSRAWSSQSSINFYIDRQRSGRTGEALMPWPGEKTWSEGTPGDSRGMWCMAGVPYIVSGTTLFSMDDTGTKTTIGTIPGTQRCSFATDGVNLAIRTENTTYVYNGTTLTKVVDSDLEVAQTVAMLNNQFIYQGTGKRFGVADAGDPTSIDGLNYGSAEAVGDDLVQVYAFQSRVYMICQTSLEVWQNPISATNPPLERIEGTTSNVGTPSPFSAANTTNYMYFVGSDDVVYRISAYQPEPVSDSAISRVLRESVTSDSEGYTLVLEGQWFYIINLPTSNITLLYSESTNEWTRLSTGKYGGKHLIKGYCFAYGRHLVLGDGSGTVYEWDFNTYKSDTQVLIRERISAPINAIAAGLPGERLLMSHIDLIMETGVGNVDEQDPQIMVSFSYDGGRTFSKEYWPRIGRASESLRRIKVDNLASFYDVVVKVRVSDPNFISIHGASIALKTAGH